MAIDEVERYPIPGFLEGTCTQTLYSKWLENKADTLLKRDVGRRKPYALGATPSLYKEKIHAAVLQSGLCDPYTGDKLDWALIGTWDTSHDHPESYKKQFALMPTVDHITPDELEFEICSWIVNESKSNLNPQEFVNLCDKVVQHRMSQTENTNSSISVLGRGR